MLIDAEHIFGHHGAPDIGPLVAGIDGVMIAPGVIVRGHGARLHGVGGHPVDDKRIGDHMVGFCHFRVGASGIAVFRIHGFVVGRLGAQGRGIGRIRRRRRHVRRQGIVIDENSFRRVLGLIDALGDDQGHRLAHMAHPVVGQPGPVGPEHGRAVAQLAWAYAAHETEAVGLVIFAGQHQ